jgi:ABC-type transport system substrate-binding protein
MMPQQLHSKTASSHHGDTSYNLNVSNSQNSLVSTGTLGMNPNLPPLLDKQIREINKQKEFLLKL